MCNHALALVVIKDIHCKSVCGLGFARKQVIFCVSFSSTYSKLLIQLHTPACICYTLHALMLHFLCNSGPYIYFTPNTCLAFSNDIHLAGDSNMVIWTFLKLHNYTRWLLNVLTKINTNSEAPVIKVQQAQFKYWKHLIQRLLLDFT